MTEWSMTANQRQNAQASVHTNFLDPCNLHPKEQVAMYCEHCGVLVCHDCISLQHRGHTFSKISVILEKKKAELQSIVQNANFKIVSCQKCIETIQDYETANENETKSTVDKLKLQYDQVKEMLEKAWTDMNKQLQEKAQNDKAMFNKYINDLRKEIASINTFVQTCNDTMSARVPEMMIFLSSAGTQLNNFQQADQSRTIPLPFEYKPCDNIEQTVRGQMGEFLTKGQLILSTPTNQGTGLDDQCNRFASSLTLSETPSLQQNVNCGNGPVASISYVPNVINSSSIGLPGYVPTPIYSNSIGPPPPPVLQSPYQGGQMPYQSNPFNIGQMPYQYSPPGLWRRT